MNVHCVTSSLLSSSAANIMQEEPSCHLQWAMWTPFWTQTCLGKYNQIDPKKRTELKKKRKHWTFVFLIGTWSTRSALPVVWMCLSQTCVDDEASCLVMVHHTVSETSQQFESYVCLMKKPQAPSLIALVYLCFVDMMSFIRETRQTSFESSPALVWE